MLTQCIAVDHGPRASGRTASPGMGADADGRRQDGCPRRAARDGPRGGVRGLLADVPLRRAATPEEVAATSPGCSRRGRLRQRRGAGGRRGPMPVDVGTIAFGRVRDEPRRDSRVEVSTEHFIGGERVASDATFGDISRSTRSRSPRSPAAASARPTSRLRGRGGFPGWAALGPAARGEVITARRPDRRECRAPRGGGVRRHGDAARSLRARVSFSAIEPTTRDCNELTFPPIKKISPESSSLFL